MCMAFICFAALDATAKYVSQEVDSLMVVWARFVSHGILVAIVLLPRKGTRVLATSNLKLQLLRSLLLFLATAFNFVALVYLPMATTASIFFTVPLMVAALSVPLLGERVGWRRWSAILVGFCGVLVIVQPGDHGFRVGQVENQTFQKPIAARYRSKLRLVLTRCGAPRLIPLPEQVGPTRDLQSIQNERRCLEHGAQAGRRDQAPERQSDGQTGTEQQPGLSSLAHGHSRHRNICRPWRNGHDKERERYRKQAQLCHVFFPLDTVVVTRGQSGT